MDKPLTDYRARLYRDYLAHAVDRAIVGEAELASREPYITALIRRHFPTDRGARIFDLGCGYGAVLFFARRFGYVSVAGVDAAPDQVRAAHALGLGQVRQGDIFEALRATPDASQDVIVAFDVAEHLRKDEVLEFFDQIFRALAPGGRCIIHVPNGDAPFVGRVYFGDFTHEQAFTRASMTQLLRSAGFSRIDCFEDTPVVHGAKSAARAALWRCIRGVLRFYVAVETGSAPASAIFSQNFLTVALK